MVVNLYSTDVSSPAAAEVTYTPIPPREPPPSELPPPESLPLQIQSPHQNDHGSNDLGFAQVNLNITVNTPITAADSEYEQALPIRPQPPPRALDTGELSPPVSGHIQYINVREIPPSSPPAYSQTYVNNSYIRESEENKDANHQRAGYKAPIPLPRENNGYVNRLQVQDSIGGIYVKDVNVDSNPDDVELGYMRMDRP